MCSLWRGEAWAAHLSARQRGTEWGRDHPSAERWCRTRGRRTQVGEGPRCIGTTCPAAPTRAWEAECICWESRPIGGRGQLVAILWPSWACQQVWVRWEVGTRGGRKGVQTRGSAARGLRARALAPAACLAPAWFCVRGISCAASEGGQAFSITLPKTLNPKPETLNSRP